MNEATPIQCSTAASPEKVKRHVFCRHYDTCLDYAIKMGWNGFSCEACPGYERERKTSEQWSEEAGKCLILLHCVAFSRLSLKVTRTDSNVTERKKIRYKRSRSSSLGSRWQEVQAGL